MKSPPNSPDLNQIELVWHDLKQHVRKCRCTSEKEIIQACKEFQNKLTSEYCRKIQIVIKKEGEWSNY
jgi:transposase